MIIVCLGSGPSLAEEDCEYVRNANVFSIAINSTLGRAPWADALYAMDAAWWRANYRKALAFAGAKYSPRTIPGVKKVWINHGNSGAGAIQLAINLGAKKVILLGYDCTVKNGTHWHGDHETTKNPDEGKCEKWQAQFDILVSVAAQAGVEVVNCSRATELKAFRRGELHKELEMPKGPICIDGMHGMGDNLHQRAIVRELMKDREVWLDTPWPSIYHDLVGEGLKLFTRGSRLRTQAKNLAREAGAYSTEPLPSTARSIRVKYAPDMVRKYRGVLQAMSATVGVPVGDFRLPVPRSWKHGLNLPKNKPVLIVRPLIERTEWGGCRNRNPDIQSWLSIYRAIRDRFFVVSVADLVDNVEWMVHEDLEADITLHKGELDFNGLAALWGDADLVMTAPGFGAVLAQAVGTPAMVVFGGYEGGYSFSAGAVLTPTLSIVPKHECDCFSHTHKCDKTLDLDKALSRAEEFIHEYCTKPEKLVCNSR